MHHPAPPSARLRGLTLVEVSAATSAAAVLIGLTLPALAKGRTDALTDVSLDNLRVLGSGYVSYAADWNDRQPTHVSDELSTFGDDASSAFSGFFSTNGNDAIPGVGLGWGLLDDTDLLIRFRYRAWSNPSNARLVQPIEFEADELNLRGFGSFRFINSSQFRQYVSTRFYDRIFYAPADEVVSPLVDPLFDAPFGYVDREATPGFGDAPYWASYVLSPAAMFDPEVMKAQVATPDGFKGGWSSPYSLDQGFRSPQFSAARYPNLKTLMLEHHWLQNTPKDPCNPDVEFSSYGGCEPWYFNQGIDSAPATIFYDGSTRLFTNAEAVDSDERLRSMNGGGDGTWSRTTPFGEDGYFGDISFDGTQVSHHILTADGILGRDTLGPSKNPPNANAPARSRFERGTELGVGRDKSSGKRSSARGLRTPSNVTGAPSLLSNRPETP
ncbi:MAG: hypothetical protein AB8G96_17150 [Phycisphaerales bacterium]